MIKTGLHMLASPFIFLCVAVKSEDAFGFSSRAVAFRISFILSLNAFEERAFGSELIL